MPSLRRLATLALVGTGAALAVRGTRRRKTYRFENRVVAITGGSRGLGLVLARELAREGAKLVLLARDPRALERARDELTDLGADVLAIACDVRDPRAVVSAVERTIGTFGRIDVLVNDAGILQAGPLEHMLLEDFEDAMDTNCMGALHTTLAVVPHMRRAGGGRIANIASVGGLIPVPHMLPYTASKFALVGLSEGLRIELAKDRIVVTTVCPGLMRTGSPVNVSFKGDAKKEFAWFALSDRMPLLAMDARKAALKILAGIRRGDAQLLVGGPTRLAKIVHALLPGTFTALAALANRYLLPAAIGPEGDLPRKGFEVGRGDEDSLANNEMPVSRLAS